MENSASRGGNSAPPTHNEGKKKRPHIMDDSATEELFGQNKELHDNFAGFGADDQKKYKRPNRFDSSQL